jgi:hypothetical protein
MIKSKAFISMLLVLATLCSLFSITALATDTVGTCAECHETYAYTLDYSQWTVSVHCVRYWCSNCGFDQAGGVIGESHSFGSDGYCTKCGYYDAGHVTVCSHSSTTRQWRTACEWQDVCTDCGTTVNSGVSHGSTTRSWNGCRYYDYCNNCGEPLSSGYSHTYSYGAWSYYNTTRHQGTGTCSGCGATTTDYGNHRKTTKYEEYTAAKHKKYSYCADYDHSFGTPTAENHSLTAGAWQNHNATQHKRTVSCSCGYSKTEYADHELVTESVENVSATQHRKNMKCVCGFTTSVPENHSFIYGSCESISDTDHCRSKTCSCSYSSTEIENHADADSNGSCDKCGHLTSHFSVTVPASLSIVMSESGEIHTASNAVIVNNSTAPVKVSAVTVTAANGWKIVPFSTNMATERVNSRLIGFSVNGCETAQTGTEETLTLASPWTINKNGVLPLSYDAVVSATSQAVSEQVLTVTFVVGWAA